MKSPVIIEVGLADMKLSSPPLPPNILVTRSLGSCVVLHYILLLRK
jgi:chemotaxis receptor (MCP) glutamine deamidase CheD